MSESSITKAITIYYGELHYALRDAIEAKGGEFVYEREEPSGPCLYVHGATEKYDADEDRIIDNLEDAVTGCLVGDVMHRMGVSLERLHRSNLEGASELLESLEADGTITWPSPDTKRRAFNYLTVLQRFQDQGHTWADSKLRADMWIEGYGEGWYGGKADERSMKADAGSQEDDE